MTQSENAIAEALAGQGLRAITHDEFVPQHAIDATREQCRRYAAERHVQVLMKHGGTIADAVAQTVELPPRQIAEVLATVGGLIGTVGALYGATAMQAAELMQCAAVALDDRAQAGSDDRR
ncbi:hypothetical protein [Streptomyces sp. C10-9-1]|uniref:hypothetical protein n=1 Tax=Streptomyces sp. C10-9-1 TaxID=1859285 RepID=UPI003F4A7ED2